MAVTYYYNAHIVTENHLCFAIGRRVACNRLVNFINLLLNFINLTYIFSKFDDRRIPRLYPRFVHHLAWGLVSFLPRGA